MNTGPQVLGFLRVMNSSKPLFTSSSLALRSQVMLIKLFRATGSPPREWLQSSWVTHGSPSSNVGAFDSFALNPKDTGLGKAVAVGGEKDRSTGNQLRHPTRGQRAGTLRSSGIVQQWAGTPQSYRVKTNVGRIRINRYHLIPTTAAAAHGRSPHSTSLQVPVQVPPRCVFSGVWR